MPDNIYKTGAGSWRGNCDNCACAYCDGLDCPWPRRFIGPVFEFCLWSHEMGSCPRLDCDYFYNRFVRGNRYRKISAPRLQQIGEYGMTKAEMTQLTKQFNDFFHGLQALTDDLKNAVAMQEAKNLELQQKVAKLEYRLDTMK